MHLLLLGYSTPHKDFWMAEKIDLTTPFKPDPREAADLSVAKLVLDFAGQGIHITLSKNGVKKEVSYNGAEATTLMIALNKANLSTKSLQRRILERIIADNQLSGVVSGSPD